MGSQLTISPDPWPRNRPFNPESSSSATNGHIEANSSIANSLDPKVKEVLTAGTVFTPFEPHDLYDLYHGLSMHNTTDKPEKLHAGLPNLMTTPIVDEQGLYARETLIPHPYRASLLNTNEAHDGKKALDDKGKLPRWERNMRAAIRETAVQAAARLGSARKCYTQSPGSVGSYVSSSDISTVIGGNGYPKKREDLRKANYEGFPSESNTIFQYHESYDTSGELEEYEELRNAPNDFGEGPSTHWYNTTNSYGASATGSFPTENAFANPSLASTAFEQEFPLPHETYPPADPSSYQQANFHQRDNSWTSSRTWVSGEEMERNRWRNIQKNMQHNGLGESPLAPQAFEEYIEHRLEAAESAAKEATEQLRQREDRAAMLGRHLSAGKPLKELASSLSIVKCILFQRKTPSPSAVPRNPRLWNNSTYFYGNADWPTRTELKKTINERSLDGYNRSLPAPSFEYDYLFYEGLNGHCEKKTNELAQELELSEINWHTRQFIEEIDRMD